MKSGTPFRLGTTSFIYPDSWLANVERLAGRVHDVEILFFDLDNPDTWPCPTEQSALAEWKSRAQLTYTLHTPLKVSLASEDERRRRESVATVCRAIELAAPFEPDAYVVHVCLGEREHDPFPADLAAWRRRAVRSLEEILARGVAPGDLCVESLDYDFAYIEPVISDLGLSAAIDIGHLRRDGRSEGELLRRNLHRVRLIHWHGVDPSGRDHRSLAHYPREHARRLLDMLLEESYRGVLTLEVFGESDFEESLAIVGSLLEGR
ncbi:MAG: cobamide remodeling phosphodiesterase CbiR [Pseudomonadota bacterium]